MSNQTRHILKWMNPVPTEDEMVAAAAPHILNTDDDITPADLEFVREVITATIPTSGPTQTLKSANYPSAGRKPSSRCGAPLPTVSSGSPFSKTALRSRKN